MVSALRRAAPETGDGKVTVVEGLGGDSSLESEVKKLRGRWELACVLNFLKVFEPVIRDNPKLTAEEIEMGLIESNSSNARLHIVLLKGIRPVSKSLDDSDAWIAVLCKKLAPWWPWIAEGEIPITASKGEEISEYRALDPTNRLRILKALCELRADQDDTLSYIHDNLKRGTEVSCFRKEKLGGDGNRTSYWFDGNAIQGYRLYREVNEIERKTKSRRNSCFNLPPASFLWETVATNLDEFYIVSRELSSSRAFALAATGKMIETDAIPVVEKYHKKKERAMKRKMRQEKVLSISENFFRPMRITRSCRDRVPVTYTFDEFDRMISEAVGETEETVPLNEQQKKRKIDQSITSDSSNSSDDNMITKSTDLEAPDSENDAAENGYNRKNEEGSGVKNHGHHAANIKEPADQNREMGTKHRLRQRPTRNSALLGSTVVPDSEDET